MIVRTANGHAAMPVRDLFPYAYNWRAVKAGPQRIYKWEGYEELIRSGAKRQTIRIDDPFRAGPAEVVFEKDSGEVTAIPTIVTDVRTVERSGLTELDVQRDGFETLADLHSALDQHYPSLADDDTVDLVTFDVL
ncbi:ASCH domain-containing protein [Dietzia cercidiphylli]|uniref:ASCH domain-containing protein n=1 Tax=Dietzia cercidiphylli TaxID=498199 RepID=UPI003F7FF946